MSDVWIILQKISQTKRYFCCTWVLLCDDNSWMSIMCCYERLKKFGWNSTFLARTIQKNQVDQTFANPHTFILLQDPDMKENIGFLSTLSVNHFRVAFNSLLLMTHDVRCWCCIERKHFSYNCFLHYLPSCWWCFRILFSHPFIA